VAASADKDATALEPLLAEQIAYYRALAPEYELGALTDEGADELEAALEAFGPSGDVLELACGTGMWTAQLARHAASLTAVDASPEMLARARSRVGESAVRFIHSDIFAWRPAHRYDTVVFGFWLSHVPLERFARFWSLVGECLRPGGRVFFADDAHITTEERIAGEAGSSVRRLLRDGSEHRIVKVAHTPEDLEARLVAVGWSVRVKATSGAFYWGEGALADGR
jgi:SAM-dependent methyltransferase